ncbi:hypothetical protein ES705_49946 [subsurface metagenome]
MLKEKSGIDLYGSLIQGHKRFVAEIQRAIEKDLTFAVFIECTEKEFVAKKFKGGYRLKTKSKVLRKIIDTFMERYPIEFVWCKDRDDLRKKMCLWFVSEIKELEHPSINCNCPSCAEITYLQGL